MEIKYSIWLALVFLLVGTASPQVTGYAPGNEPSAIGESSGYPTGYDLIGQVVDVFGKGISGATIIAVGDEAGVLNNATNDITIGAVTNATGYYSLNVPYGNYTITAEHPGYSFTTSVAQVGTGRVSIAQNIAGYPVGTASASLSQYGPAYVGDVGWLQGRIVDQSGAGVPFASIIVDGLQTGVLTDDQGGYSLALSPGIHRIGVLKSGYGVPPRVVFINAGQTTNFAMFGMRTISLGRGRLAS